MCLRIVSANWFVVAFRGSGKGLVIPFMLLLLSKPALVGAETRQHGSHVHGIAEMNVVLDGKNLIIEMISPAANITGFEHAPKNEEQERAIHEAAELLKDGEKLLLLDKKAECQLHEAVVKSELLDEREKHGEHEHEGHKDVHQHDDHESEKHDHKDAHHHDDEDGHEHDDEMSHSEFELTYHFECEKPERITKMEIELFSKFSGFEKIDVQLLTPKGQTAVELTPQKHRISF
mgnify:FL=1